MKKHKMILFSFAFVLLLSGFASAQTITENVCCERTIKGAWCQNTLESECSSSYSAATTSCAQTSFCQLGTCVNTITGICMENTPKNSCESLGGSWYNQDRQSISMCKAGCCQLGNEVAFVSQTECKQLASDYGIDIKFLSSVNDEPSCLALANSNSLGACVYTGESRKCSMLEKESCLKSSGNFYEGLLCTAQELKTNCAASSKTMCFGNDVYFLDSCGNKANIYDDSFDPVTSDGNKNSKYNEYWTKVYKPSDYSLMKLSGDCNYALGTTCKENRGVNTCVDLSCKDVLINGVKVTKKHGESWCAETSGTMHHIKVDSQTMEFVDKKQLDELILNYNKYNIPGSRYVRLQCWEGEVMVEPCADYRNEICKEADISMEFVGSGSYTIAQCRANTWRQCLEITSKDSCEDPALDCLWIPGYRFDLTKVSWSSREEEQGSCLPLFAPGFDFWNPESDGQSICELGSISETVLYETNWLTEGREKLKDNLGEATQNCYANCFAIPGYAKGLSAEEVKKIHTGEKEFVSGKFISDRLGYYCEGKTGAVNVLEFDFSNKIKCANTNNQPIYYTNVDWLRSITQRAALLGDCGYKPAMNGVMGQNSTEIITSIMSKLTQKGEIKKNMTETRTIYKADLWNKTIDPRTEEVSI